MKLNTLNKLLLIAHHPEKGRFITPSVYLQYGIIGAALLEMSLDGQIKIEDDKLILVKNIKYKNPIISEISTIISNSKKPRKIRYWITKLGRKYKKFKWIIITELEKERLLRIEEKRFLGLIPYRKTYLIETKTREQLISKLRDNILYRKDMSEDSILMLALIEACKMHKIITTDKIELKKIKKELKIIIKENPIAKTLDKTIQQVQAAIIGAIVASTVAASAAGAN